ncbi:EamA family transporter [Botryobacter ruber]|uniref:EamA family transporter n=1 Tax=Botryobacter ruber TaxID=2171629 RepID=UPI000E0A5C2C|nr:EamA family transporter [Botryobacter ruber]
MSTKELAKAALAPVLWGTLYYLSTEILPKNYPWFISTMRALPIGLVLFLYYRRLPEGAWWFKSIVLGFVSVTVGFGVFFLGATRLPGSVASTIFVLQPLIVILLCRLMLQEKAHLLSLGAGVLGVVGVGLLVLTAGNSIDTIGIIATVVATLAFSLGGVLIKKWGIPVKLPVFLSWIFLSGGLMLLPFTLLLEKQIPAFTLKNSLGYGYLSLVATGVAYFFWFRGIDKMSPNITSFLILFSPLVASVIGLFFLGETFTAWQGLGAFTVVASVVLGEMGQSKKMRRKGLRLYSQFRHKAVAMVR